jgi:hypothetical protein
MKTLIAATLAGGLLVDQYWPRFGQEVASVAAWAVLALLWVRAEPRLRPAFVACLLIATAGELFLSLVWGLYEYRRGNIPLFVPPGHVLLFYLGTQLAEHIPDGSEWWVAGLSAPLVAAYAWHGQDTLGLLLFAIFFASILGSPSRKLYATMFVLSLSLELYGTWIGNWVWPEQVPWLGLTQDNPPLAAGAFYCALDLLVVMATRRWVNPKSPERARDVVPREVTPSGLVPADAASRTGTD